VCEVNLARRIGELLNAVDKNQIHLSYKLVPYPFLYEGCSNMTSVYFFKSDASGVDVLSRGLLTCDAV
jgi:ABC-type antimicrobial peptide transport system permease subunit